MRLIPGDRICFASQFTSFCLYDTSAIETTTDIPPIDSPIWDLPIWEADASPGRLEHLSQLYHCRNTDTLRLILNINEELYGIVIPCNPKATPRPTMHKLMDFGYPQGFCRSMSLGYNTAIWGCSMHYYSWPDGPGRPLHLSKPLTAQVYSNMREVEHFIFDEGSGRVVVGGHYEIFVSDFAKFQKCI